jgi:hypothetical protein
VEVKDFRPISLFHSFGKYVAKLLAMRLAPRMSEHVHANQSASSRGAASRITSSLCSRPRGRSTSGRCWPSS